VEVFVADTGSRNGTRLNDMHVEDDKRFLTSGDVVRFGDVRLTFLSTKALYALIRRLAP
jgi:hypothetical protein